jgi:homoaconitase/3-isopropylmalate dehydratase large subunit
MGNNLARQLIADHLVEGEMRPGEEIALKIDQFLLHDGTGPLWALQLEAMGVEQISAETVVAYVDHLLVEADSKNADDHILLQSAARRFGMWFSRAGNGTSHPVHQQRFGERLSLIAGAPGNPVRQRTNCSLNDPILIPSKGTKYDAKNCGGNSCRDSDSGRRDADLWSRG